MGELCSKCQQVDHEPETTITVPKESYLEPADFYNAATKAIAIQYGPFKYSEEDLPPFKVHGPIEIEKGSRYYGQFSNAMRNGLGKQVWEDFTLYEGFWEDDQINGRGRMINPNGDVY